MRADATQPAQDVREMAPEHTAIGVQLVDDDILRFSNSFAQRG